jgi:putative NADH-flavin reductase
MQITIFGAGGRVGQLVTKLCLERGYEVVAVVHKNNPFHEAAGLRVVTADIYDQASVTTALQGSEVVISTLGSWHTPQQNVLASAMAILIPAMKNLGIQRIITVTGSAALWSGDDPKWFNKIDHLTLGLIAPKVLRDGEAHLKLLATSELDWTSIRSPVMTDKQVDTYVLRPQLPTGMKFVPRLAVATSIVDQVERRDLVGQAPVIYQR